jgi:hypothetical protein
MIVSADALAATSAQAAAPNANAPIDDRMVTLVFCPSAKF